jgi:hypothetical protein
MEIKTFKCKITVIFLIVTLIMYSHADKSDDDCPCCESAETREPAEWVLYGGFLFLLIILSEMFWAMAVVCEDFFVPALTIMCEEYKVKISLANTNP